MDGGVEKRGADDPERITAMPWRACSRDGIEVPIGQTQVKPASQDAGSRMSFGRLIRFSRMGPC